VCSRLGPLELAVKEEVNEKLIRSEEGIVELWTGVVCWVWVM